MTSTSDDSPTLPLIRHPPPSLLIPTLPHHDAWPRAVFSRSPSTPRSRHLKSIEISSPPSPTACHPADFSTNADLRLTSDSVFSQSPLARAVSPPLQPRTTGPILKKARRTHGFQRNAILLMLSLLVFFFLFDWWVLSRLRTPMDDDISEVPLVLQGEWSQFPKGERPARFMYGRLLALAAHALAEHSLHREPKELWKEPSDAAAWEPCAQRQQGSNNLPFNNNTGYIMISANGGLNQQRVAICNGVAVARMLNATLVLPRFQFSTVWRDTSQFGDIYQEKIFIEYLKDDVRVVRELPPELQSLDLEAIGSIVTDMDIMKEAKPSFYITQILPILLRNRVVHFIGFGNRLSFDPIPFDIQKLRCKCNFHALKFVPSIQMTGALLVRRMREKTKWWGPATSQDHGRGGMASSQKNALNMLVDPENNGDVQSLSNVKYLGLHLRFEIDMAAYSMCEFGGGDKEREELEAYREKYFPTLSTYEKKGKLLSASQLREEGKCPLTPEEAALMLVALGFNRETRIYVAGAHIYGGHSRMLALTSLYPNLVTKEDLLSDDELEPFANKSSQLAALDFIGCAAADMFGMTDSGSQLSSLVSGFRIYFGGGLLPTIRPNKRRLASIFSKNTTIDWEEFQERVRKSIKESKQVQVRPVARSVYRHPRCLECMCKTNESTDRNA